MDCERLAVPLPLRFTVRGELVIEPPADSVIADVLELDDVSRTDEP